MHCPTPPSLSVVPNLGILPRLIPLVGAFFHNLLASLLAWSIREAVGGLVCLLNKQKAPYGASCFAAFC